MTSCKQHPRKGCVKSALLMFRAVDRICRHPVLSHSAVLTRAATLPAVGTGLAVYPTRVHGLQRPPSARLCAHAVVFALFRRPVPASGSLLRALCRGSGRPLRAPCPVLPAAGWGRALISTAGLQTRSAAAGPPPGPPPARTAAPSAGAAAGSAYYPGQGPVPVPNAALRMSFHAWSATLTEK